MADVHQAHKLEEYLQALTNWPDVSRQGYAANFVAMTTSSGDLFGPGKHKGTDGSNFS
jgi:hypothetical protein